MLLGEQTFVQRFKDRLGGKGAERGDPAAATLRRPSQAEIFAPGRRTTQTDRNHGMRQAHMDHGYTLKQIAEYLGLNYTTVSRAVQAVEARRRI